jgi:DNA-binding CsgD family transcriptional regulator/tetratricopeptide (TPR) repeat protein
VIAPWPLTGRSTQLEELGRHYRDPARAGVVLHGPAGVGKTRLAEEALRLAERGGRIVSRAVGHPATQEIPLGALAHLLPADLTAELGVGDDERTGLFHAARAELRRLAGDDRLVLLVDDLDLLDDTSVAVLVPLIMSRTVFLIGTVRTGRTPSPRLSVLHRDGHLVRMEIAPLDPDDLGTLLHRALDGPVSETARAELSRLSGGNLQVLTELVRGARERGVLVDAGGAWDLLGPLPTTAALDELVAEHLAGIEPRAYALLELLAVCERFGLVDVERNYGTGILESLELSGIIEVVTSGRRMAVRLAHPLYGEVLRAGLPPLRMRRVQAELADSVEAHGGRRREDALLIALWRVASGGKVGGERLLRAARLALAAHEPALAVELLNAADAADLPIAERAEALVEAYSMAGARDEIEHVVAAVWDEPLSEQRRAHLAKRLADSRFFNDSDLDGALAAHEAARERMSDPDEIAAVDARRAALLAGAGRPLEALRITDAMAPVSSPRTRVEVSTAVAISLISVGRTDEAAALARESGAEHADLPGWLARRGIAQHLVNEAHALAYTGRYIEARRLLEPAVERALATSAMGAWIWFNMTLGEIARDTGRAHETIRRFREVAEVAPRIGQDATLVWAHVGVAQGHLLLGQCGPAAAALELADQAGDSPVATSFGTRERTRAWLDACRGDLTAARQQIRDIIPRHREDGVYIFESALLHDLARLGSPHEAVDRLEQLAGCIDGPLATIHAAHARALAERDVAKQRDVIDRYEEIDVLVLAAEAAAELADMHRARAESRLATAAQQRAADLADRAGGLHTPGLARGEGIEPLTSREREVALMAAAGRSSKDIGDRLGLSTRTVDTHLARVYRKLGIPGRSELASALGDASTVTT